MNLSSILHEIEQQDPEVYERLSPRRHLIKTWSRRVTLTALPFALGNLFKKAYGKGNDAITNVLNYALTLEYLEEQFYAAGLNAQNLIPANQRADVQKLYSNEASHVNFLRGTIAGLGGTPVSQPNFDFTGGNGGSTPGPFANVLTNYATFLGVAQAFEDTGVRAYKGAAPDLAGNDIVLEAALRIHSVEGRHAAKVRFMRMMNGFGGDTLRPWVVQEASGGLPAGVDPVYDGEDLSTQLGIAITGVNGAAITADAATAAFDEPLSMMQVLAIVDPFII